MCRPLLAPGLAQNADQSRIAKVMVIVFDPAAAGVFRAGSLQILREGEALDCHLESRLPVAQRASVRSPARQTVSVAVEANTTQGESRGTRGSLLRTAWRSWRTHTFALADQAV